MRTIRSTITTAAALATLTFGLAGCGQDETAQSQQDTTTIVASTDVWGSVAAAVAGDHATVESILTGPAADPHSFEATPAEAAAITDASLVVFNGGHYDHWFEEVLSDHPEVPAVDAYALLNTSDQPANEHVFYDISIAKAVATSIADHLAQSDAAHAESYRANAAEFNRQADGIAQTQRAIAQTHPGASVVVTEPVAYYLLRNAGITDRTPTGFANAVEEGDDPAPADVAAILDLIEDNQVSALVFNPQTETPATRQIADTARRVGIPVVTVTETLPDGTDYLTWQRQTVAQLASQLDHAPQTVP